MARVPIATLVPSPLGQWVFAWVTPTIPAGLAATVVVVAMADWLPTVLGGEVVSVVTLRVAAGAVFAAVYMSLNVLTRRHFREHQAEQASANVGASNAP